MQHLPGLYEQVQSKGLFVTFPDENAQAPSKAQLKKLGKKGGSGPPVKFAADAKDAPVETKEAVVVTGSTDAKPKGETVQKPEEEKKYPPKQKQV